MHFKDQLRFVRQNMKKSKLRIFMTVLATAIGIAFLILLASVGFGLHSSIIEEVTEKRLVTEIDVHGKDVGNGYERIQEEDIRYFESMGNVKSVVRRIRLRQMPIFSIEDYEVHGDVMVTDFSAEIKAGFELSEGRLPETDNEIVVGYHFQNGLTMKGIEPDELFEEDRSVKEEYQYTESLIGKTVALKVVKHVEGEEHTHSIPVTIVGIEKEPTRSWMQSRKAFISNEILHEIEQFTEISRGAPMIPEGKKNEMGEMGDGFDEVFIYANNVNNVEGIVHQLEDQNYLSYSIVSEMKEINTIFIIVKTGLIIVGTIAIIIASIGIYNTMTMAVTERAPDIGIMKALGASPKTIKHIFLLESCYIGFIGAIIGTLIAYAVSFGINFFLPMVLRGMFDSEAPLGIKFSHIPVSLIVIAVSICLAVTIFSGMNPAKKATKIDVLKALRREV
ncbi:ABC transporter permease [Salirhabdus salicampi]|uniref:ABC transporter permease n=1 Tax=Salirhabdus salicampi TaxID=476102 RepID=UPI0020C1C7BB|nr:ABC transporter permease [Salirhabdus salicampi]MCP8615747.1 ABC transporter permease [Salirhabdus salicampi]